MATIATYADALWQRQKRIAVKMGADIARSEKQDRVLNRALLVLMAALVKTLVDKGVITDGELVATLNTARDDTYVDEPIEAPPPEPT